MTKTEYIKKYGAEKYEEYRERRKEISKRYREKNADKISEYMNDPKNKERAKIRAKQWYESHKEYAIKRQADYIKANPDVKKKSQSNYRENHKQQIKVYESSKNGRAVHQATAYRVSDARQGRGVSTITHRYILDHIYTQPCFYCGETDWTKLGCDRIDNSLPHTPENCVCSCYKCNTKRGKQDFKSFCEKMGVK
jgi:hypothetical protein